MLRNNHCVGMVSRAQLVMVSRAQLVMVSRAQLVNDSGNMLSGGFMGDSQCLVDLLKDEWIRFCMYTSSRNCPIC
jgi:hypothetical protein